MRFFMTAAAHATRRCANFTFDGFLNALPRLFLDPCACKKSGFRPCLSLPTVLSQIFILWWGFFTKPQCHLNHNGLLSYRRGGDNHRVNSPPRKGSQKTLRDLRASLTSLSTRIWPRAPSRGPIWRWYASFISHMHNLARETRTRAPQPLVCVWGWGARVRVSLGRFAPKC